MGTLTESSIHLSDFLKLESYQGKFHFLGASHHAFTSGFFKTFLPTRIRLGIDYEINRNSRRVSPLLINTGLPTFSRLSLQLK